MPRSVKLDFAEGAEERPAMVSEVQWFHREICAAHQRICLTESVLVFGDG
jgi:hypothetical protein